MNEDQFKKYISEIIREIERHKWLESEKAGYDIGGNAAAFDWINRHYPSWKRTYGSSSDGPSENAHARHT